MVVGTGRILLLCEPWILVPHPWPTSAFYLLFLSKISPHWEWHYRGQTPPEYLVSIWCPPLQPEEIQKPGGKILSSSHLQLPKQLWFLLKQKKCAFQFPREMSEPGLNGFSQVPSGFCVSSSTFSNPSCLMLTQPSHHTGFWCVRSHRLSQLTCITAKQQSSFCSISGTREDSGFYAPVMSSTQILCRFPN